MARRPPEETARVRRSTELRRPEIADAALRLIGSRGIASLTMSALAEEVGVTSGALFRHFRSREEILVEVVRRAEELLTATEPPAELPPLERLSRLAVARSGVVGQHAGLARLLLSEQFSLALPAPAVERLHALILRTRKLITAALREAAERGEVRADQPPEALALIVMGTVQAMALAGAGGVGGAVASGGAPARLWETLLALLAPPPKPRRR